MAPLGLGSSFYGIGPTLQGSTVLGRKPDDIPNLGIWLKNDTEVAVDEWTDQSGNARHAVQADTDLQGTVSDGGINFDVDGSTNDFMRITTATSAAIQLKHPNPYTLAVVFKREGAVDDDNVIIGDDNTNKFIGFLTEETVVLNGASVVFGTNTWEVDKKLAMVVTKAADGDLLFFKNGVSVTIASGATASTATADFLVDFVGTLKDGTQQGNDKHFDGTMYEFILYTSALTGNDLGDLNSYLTSAFSDLDLKAE